MANDCTGSKNSPAAGGRICAEADAVTAKTSAGRTKRISFGTLLRNFLCNTQ